jgi:MFS family permease
MLWFATWISNVGTGMQDVANGWLMTTLAPEPLMVSLIQTATSLPMFVLALPAGALADVVDRRIYLLCTQCWMMLGAATMGLLTITGHMTAWRLVLSTFVMSLGSAMNSPGWHAVTPEIVSRQQLPAAVSLNGLAINVARAMGPAVGVSVLVWLGPGQAFLLNAATFLAVLYTLWRWKRQPQLQNLPSERFFSSMRLGVQFVRHSPAMRSVLVRSSLFMFGNSALWALMPLLSRQSYGMGPRGYGLLMTLFGFGAVSGAVRVLPWLRARLSANSIVGWTGLVYGLAMFGLSQAHHPWLEATLMFVSGTAWICIMSSFHLAAQSIPPAWVRGRAMSVYILCLFGTQGLGATLWGLLAGSIGLRSCLLGGALVMLITSLIGWLIQLQTGERLHLQPSGHWGEPEVAFDVPLQHGPIMVEVTYDIDPVDGPAFRKAIEVLRRLRLQNGVLRWGLFVDLARPRHYREVYLEETWSAHLRQHQRVTTDEAELARKVYAFHKGLTSPEVSHHAYCDAHWPTPEFGMRPGGFSFECTPEGVPLWFLDEDPRPDTVHV